MTPQIIKLLSEKNSDNKFLTELLQHCKDLVALSRGKMEENYDKWDQYIQMWKGERDRDLQDVKALERKEPEKFTIPISYSQIETFVSFCSQVFTQRPTFFELEGTGTEDIKAAKVGENVLEYNLTYNRFKGEKLPQFLRNIGRCGIGILKECWHEELRKITKQVPLPSIGSDGTQLAPIMVEQVVDEIAYQGNKITAVSPYRFFPDPRVPLTSFQDGEFCANDETYTRNQLRRFEYQGLVAGVAHIEPFKVDIHTSTRRKFGFGIDPNVSTPGVDKGTTLKNIEVTEIIIELIPAEWARDGVSYLGDSQEPIKFLIWYANDNRIIRLEEFGYLHNRFPYSVAQFTNDNLQYLNGGLGELLAQIQDVQNWLINAHITSVRKNITNMFIVDPKGVEMTDFDNRRPVIRLRGSALGSGVDRWVKQLQINDVTQNHVADAGVMGNYAKETTGITENLLGQFASGRRSATEARSVSTNAAARLLLIANSIWEVGILPLGQRMLSNCRDGMTAPQLVRVLGESNFIENQEGVGRFITVDKSQLIGNYDFLIFDGTLPSQRGAIAQSLQELLLVMLQKPETALLFQLNPLAILDDILTYRGIRNLSKYRLNPEQAQGLIGLAQNARNATTLVNRGGAGGQPPGVNPQQGAG